MYMSNSGFAPRRRQGGFIQGAILFALVIIAVVVAAFSLANRDSNNNADVETARVAATVLMTTGTNVSNGINRALADGFSSENVSGKLKLVGTANTASGEVDLFDSTLRYAVRPELPRNSLTVDTQPFASGTTGADAAAFVSAAITGIGSTRKDVRLEVPNIPKLVCQRINNLANGKVVSADPAATAATTTAQNGTDQAREGCYGAGPNYTYFRVVLVDAEAAA